jgi:hypothetical protein
LSDAIAGSERWVCIGRVSHVDFAVETEQWGREALKPFFWKRLGFDHEYEVRAMTPAPDSQHAPGILIPVDLDVLVEEIVIASQAEEWFADLVRALAARHGIDIPIRYSPLKAEPIRG